ncbi:MAG TPA: peptidoglycan recognition family protein, partial [Pyrinomonadaceae bacterium]
MRPGRAAAALALLLIAAGLFFGVSYANTIRPAGVVIHHSALPPTPGGRPADLATIERIHRERGFGAFYWGRSYHVGYHYIILPDGTVQAGRPEHCRGAHATGFNSYIGICLIGDFSSRENPSGALGAVEPTYAQMRSLIELTNRLRAQYDIPLGNVIQHHDVNPNTECPGDHFPFTQFI